MRGPQRFSHGSSGLPLQGLRDLGRVVEGIDGFADDLTLLVAFSGHDEHVPSSQAADGRGDRRAAIADLQRVRRAAADLGADGGGLLRARVVVGDDGDVGEAAAISPMIGRLPRSRSPPAPNTTISRPVAWGRRALQHRLQAVGGVGVVDIGLAAVAARRRCAAAGLARPSGARARPGPRRACGRRRCRGRRRPARWRPGRRRRAAAGPRRVRPCASTVSRWPAGVGRRATSVRSRPRSPTAEQGQARQDAGGGEGVVGVGVGVQHRGAPARQQLLEQAQLGGAVGLHRAVVVEVVLGQVGEGRPPSAPRRPAAAGPPRARRPPARGGSRPAPPARPAGAAASPASGLVRPGPRELLVARHDAERAHAGAGDGRAASRSGGRSWRPRSCRWCR